MYAVYARISDAFICESITNVAGKGEANVNYFICCRVA